MNNSSESSMGRKDSLVILKETPHTARTTPPSVSLLSNLLGSQKIPDLSPNITTFHDNAPPPHHFTPVPNTIPVPHSIPIVQPADKKESSSVQSYPSL